MEFLFLNGLLPDGEKHITRSPYIRNENQSPIDLWLQAADTSRVFNPLSVDILRESLTWNMHAGIGVKDFQNAMLAYRMTADNEYTVTRNNSATSFARARTFPILLSPRVVRKVQRGVTRINDGDLSADTTLTGFTDIDKMAVMYHGSNTDNAFSNLYGWSTVQLINATTLRCKRELSGFSIYTDTAWEVIEFW
jgi:hypothetical protein